MADDFDPRELVDLLEAYLLGEKPQLTGPQIADEVGIPLEEAKKRWRSLGFTAVPDDVEAFTHADLEALELTQRLLEVGLIDPEDESALVRTLGRSFARLAEWQMGLLAKVIDLEAMDLEELSQIMEEVTPSVERLQSYVWRRHTLLAASRLLTAAGRDEEDADAEEVEDGEEGQVMGVGFADIVNYTAQSRKLSRSELAHLIDNFEGRAQEIVVAHQGQIIKTIGDEILFVADGPEEIAHIGLELIEERERTEGFPELRVGLAWGRALARLGDVLGPVVNVASRLTSTAKPGRVVVDRNLAEELKENDRFKLRRLRRTSVRGYRRLEPWALRRPAGEDPEIAEDGDLPGPASSFLHEQSRDLRRVVDQLEERLDRSSAGSGDDTSRGKSSD